MAGSNIGFKKRFTFVSWLLSWRSVLIINEHQGVLLHHISWHQRRYNQGVVCHLFWQLQMQPDRQIKLRLNWTGKRVKKKAIRGGALVTSRWRRSRRDKEEIKCTKRCFQLPVPTVPTQWIWMTKLAYKTVYCNFSIIPRLQLDCSIKHNTLPRITREYQNGNKWTTRTRLRDNKRTQKNSESKC